MENGVPKQEYKDKPEQYYRIVYTVEVNALNEAAVVKRTTKKGRHLKSRPTEKFREEIIVKDDSGDGIKIGKKFIRSQIDDITNEDVEYIKKRINHYPDTQEKMRDFRSRNKKNPPK